MKIFRIIFALLFPGVAFTMHTSGEDAASVPGLSFVENKGQWADQVKFRAGIPGGALFLTDRGFVFNYYQVADLESIHALEGNGQDVSGETVRHHAYRVDFAGANENITYRTDHKSSIYHNYFYGNEPSKWAGRVALFGKVIQQHVYDGIDVAVYSKGMSFKYDFIIAPGADAGKIALTFYGVSPQLTARGSLSIKTSVNETEELAPYAYQVIEGREVPVRCSYRLAKGRLSFDLPQDYDRRYALIIDPQLVFATYSGAANGRDFYSYCSTYDDAGNLYAGGKCWQPGWPVTTGAFQTTFGGDQDVGINKYNADGTQLLYATYYGGRDSEEPYAMVVNSRGELVVTGGTRSQNLPVTPGCYDNTFGRYYDLFVAHFNLDGSALIGATYMGGSGSGDVNAIDITGIGAGAHNKTSPAELVCDHAGNIWVVSNTSESDFPVTSTALQPAIAGGIDGVLFQLNPDCSRLLYSTFIGGSSDDAVYSLLFNPAGNLVICGGTQSADFPVSGSVLQPAAQGGWDGFVAIVNPVSGALLRSTYLGTTGNDQAVGLQADDDGNIYVLGRTLGNYPVSPGVYAQPNGDVFIDKLAPDLNASLQSTRVGNPQSSRRYSPTAFLLDVCGNVYVTGLDAVAGLPVTSDAFETTTRNFWFCVLRPGFSGLLFASYFGTTDDHTHVGTHRLDPRGIVYHSVCVGSSAYPVTPGAWATTKLAEAQDVVSFKLNFETSGVHAVFVTDQMRDTGCAPFTVPFINRSGMAERFLWDFGDGTFTTDPSPTHIFTTAGVYTVQLYAYNDTACVTHDTFSRVITVLPSPRLSVTPDTVTCVNNPVQLRADVTHDPGVNATIVWTPPTALDNATIVNPVTSALSDITYHVSVTLDGGCRAEDSVRITVLQGFDLQTPDTAVCAGEAVTIRLHGDTRYKYVWSPANGVSDTTDMAPVIVPDSSRTYVVTARYPGCRDSIRVLDIEVQPQPTIDLGPDRALCYGDTLRMNPVILPPDYSLYTYNWNPAGGLDAPASKTPLFTAYATTILTMTVSTPIGCTGTDDILITVADPDMITASADTSICPGDTIRLYVRGTQATQVWRPAYYISDTLSTDPYVYPVTPVSYTVYARDDNNCLDTQVVRVGIAERAVVTLPDSARIFPGETYRMDPDGNCIYFEWFPPAGLSDPQSRNPVANPEADTRYYVTGQTAYGCVASDSMLLYVSTDSYIDMPNAFVPGNGPNGILKPVRRGNILLKSFSVYNRWGMKLFETRDVDEGWDGLYGGRAQPMGVYVYMVEAVTPAGRIFYKQGNVTLLR